MAFLLRFIQKDIWPVVALESHWQRRLQKPSM